MKSDLSRRRETSFVLWRVANAQVPPALIIGELQEGAPVKLANEQRIVMHLVPGFGDLWEVPASACNLLAGRVYHYWFEISVNRAGAAADARVRITDPTATTVDWRLLAPRLAPPSTDDDRYPAGVVGFSAGKLSCADPAAAVRGAGAEPPPATLPPNNRMVIYELPTTWTRSAEVGGRDMGVGTFRDVMALIDANAGGENFSDLDVTRVGRAYLGELGVNGIELLPPADSIYNRQWGYGTTNHCAPDFELGFPGTYSFPAPNRDLDALVRTCHAHGIRFMVDVVMAFSKNNPYLAADPDGFFILDPAGNPTDPDAHNSRGQDERNLRNGYGASLFRYALMVDGYEPLEGQQATLTPARQLMKIALERWSSDFRIDGIRMDSVENVQNWDFIQQYKDLARELNRDRFSAQGSTAADADARFLVVGEELSEPLALLAQKRLDGLWHDSFKHYMRMALVGRNHENESSFEATVRKAIDCRAFGYSDLSQAVIYLTSHDVEGFRNERLFNFFLNWGVADIERRVRLAFACLLTAVGVPMILAGDEFADQHDLFDGNGNVTQGGGKQVDPVNFARLGEGWRTRVKEYVSRLIGFRATYDALAVNDTRFIHVDFEENKRVIVWQRGTAGSDRQVIVVANFSDYGTPDPFGPYAEYVVPGWPSAPSGKAWFEVSQFPSPRRVADAQVGREPVFPWEAKIYALW